MQFNPKEIYFYLVPTSIFLDSNSSWQLSCNQGFNQLREQVSHEKQERHKKSFLIQKGDYVLWNFKISDICGQILIQPFNKKKHFCFAFPIPISLKSKYNQIIILLFSININMFCNENVFKNIKLVGILQPYNVKKVNKLSEYRILKTQSFWLDFV